MDELVERCLVEASRVALDWVLKPDKGEPMAHVVARAIIPIVADWQRERDAGIADKIAHDERASAWRCRRPRGGFSTHETYYNSRASGANEVATAIRGSE